MSKDFFKLLNMELQMQDDKLNEPNYPNEDGDKPICEVTDITMRRLFSFAMELARSSEQIGLDAKYNTSGNREKLSEQASELAYKSQLVNSLFWITLKDELDLWGKEYLGMRTGWKVVEYTPKMQHGGFFQL